MLKRVIALLGIAWFFGPAAVAQQGIDPALIERGQLLYEINCVLCHKESGEGGVPMFPALDGNEQLVDALRIVTSISQGSGVMPPFPDLTDVASLFFATRSIILAVSLYRKEVFLAFAPVLNYIIGQMS